MTPPQNPQHEWKRVRIGWAVTATTNKKEWGWYKGNVEWAGKTRLKATEMIEAVGKNKDGNNILRILPVFVEIPEETIK